MKIGKFIFFLIFAVVVVVGLYVAFSQTKDVVVGGGGSDFMKTLLWWRPSESNSTSTQNNSVPKSPAPQNQEPAKPKVTPPIGFSERDLSPFYKKVRIASISPLNPYDYSPAHVFTLSAESGNTETIFITNWKIKGNRRAEAYIPKGISDMSPTSLGGAQGPIGLAPGEYAVFYTNTSAIGRNFRLNKCTGFLNNFHSFVPSLPNNCPALFERSEVVTFSGSCQSFLFSLSSCADVKPNDRNRFTGENDNGCRAIMDRFNFGYCYNRFRSQPDFFSREWKVWLNERPNFDREHDRILLYDSAGLLVDEYVY